MTGLSLMRALTPLGWTVLIVALLVMGLGLSRGIGLSWDVLGIQSRRLEQAKADAERGRAEALARQLETEVRAEQARQQAQVRARLYQLAEVTAHAQSAARRAPDADTPLDKDRLDRLRAHDRLLCDQSQPLAGCSPAIGASD
jgi:hypothetical protein